MAEWRAQIGPPFSLNNMFFNRDTGGRGKTPKYLAWRREQCQLLAIRPRRTFMGPVEIELWFGAQGVSPGFDTDNGIKGVLDVLVSMGVIPDDNRLIVRRLKVSWLMTVSGTEILVKDLENAAAVEGPAG